MLETPKRIALPESVIESKPRETVVIFVSPNEVMVQGEAVVLVDDILTMDGGDIEPIAERLDELSANVIGINIARAGRVVSYALPSELLLPEMLSMLEESRASSR